jgi:hypothetical protein
VAPPDTVTISEEVPRPAVMTRGGRSFAPLVVRIVTVAPDRGTGTEIAPLVPTGAPTSKEKRPDE